MGGPRRLQEALARNGQVLAKYGPSVRCPTSSLSPNTDGAGTVGWVTRHAQTRRTIGRKNTVVRLNVPEL